MQAVGFDALEKADLVVDGMYLGGRKGNAGDDPFPRLLTVSNMGGFRYRGTVSNLEMLVLTSSMSDPDWPDGIDRESGVFTYFGDNKKPGRALHDTPRFGNELLRNVFQLSHEGPEGRCKVPPILLFGNVGHWRDVVFLGLAVPGTSDLSASEDLVAIWRTSNGKRFQNYRARFTVLDAPVVSRAWLQDVLNGTPFTPNAPVPWRRWCEGGAATPLTAKRSLEHRTKAEQLPTDADGRAVMEVVRAYFRDRPHDFEACAAALARLMLPDITAMDLTRPSRDGGRDATGQFRIGRGSTSVLVDFALEAKCYGAANAVGVREMSRLISRLRHRQFGVLVTTSYVDTQTYKEIKDDGHPIVIMAASDIAELLKVNGHGTAAAVAQWLEAHFGLASL